MKMRFKLRHLRLWLPIGLGILGLIGVGFYLYEPEWFSPSRLPQVSPDSLAAYRLNGQDQQMLMEWYSSRRTDLSHQKAKWVKLHYTSFQSIGLKLLEQATLFGEQGNHLQAMAKLDTARELGHALMETTQDTFLIRQIWSVEQMDSKRLHIRALASKAFANACHQLSIGDYAEAKKNCMNVLRLSSRVGEIKLDVEAMSQLQFLSLYEGRHNEAIKLGQEIIEKAELAGYKRRLAIALQQTAKACCELDRDDEALSFIKRAITISELTKDYYVLIHSYLVQVQIYYRMESLQNADEILEILTTIDRDEGSRGFHQLHRGQISVERGEYGKAQSFYEMALDVFQQQSDEINQAITLSEQSYLYLLVGEYENALTSAEKAVDLKRKEGNAIRTAQSLSKLGLVFSEMDSLDSAIECQEEALQLLQSAGKRYRVDILLRLGEAHLKKGDCTAALKSFSVAENLSTLANYHLGKAQALLGYGRIALLLGDLQKAEISFSSALRITTEMKATYLRAESLFGLSRVANKSGELEEAAYLLEDAIKMVETLRTSISRDSLKVNYFATIQEIFDEAILLSFARNRDDLAFLYSERSRNQALLDVLGNATTKELVEGDGRVQLLETKAMSLGEVMDSIPDHAQIVEYRVLPDMLIIWVLNRNKVKARQVRISSKSLEYMVQQFLQSLGAEDLDSFKARVMKDMSLVYEENRRQGQEIYRVLIEPIAHDISTHKQLYIIPDAFLHRLPFGALVTDQGRFVDEDYVWVKSPSLTVLAKNSRFSAQPLDPKDSRILTIAGDWTSTTEHAELIKRLFKTSSILLKDDANYLALERQLCEGAQIVYLSVHAVADTRHPMNSYIELRESNHGENHHEFTKVYARQLLNLNLSKTWLAILNACETANGKLARGEGALNIVRIFSLAGVPIIVASLWKNDDRRSAQVIGKFFEWFSQGVGVPVALHRAKRHIIAKLKSEDGYALPYFWAVFETYANNFRL